jgi:hypothetical protein
MNSHRGHGEHRESIDFLCALCALCGYSSAFRIPHSLLFPSGLDILQRVFSLLNFLFRFAADILINFE